jgi:hypothetical protein
MAAIVTAQPDPRPSSCDRLTTLDRALTGPLAIRAEYEYFDSGGTNPGLVSLGITWTFF